MERTKNEIIMQCQINNGCQWQLRDVLRDELPWRVQQLAHRPLFRRVLMGLVRMHDNLGYKQASVRTKHHHHHTHHNHVPRSWQPPENVPININ